MKLAEPVVYEKWHHRGLWHKAEDALAYLGSSQL